MTTEDETGKTNDNKITILLAAMSLTLGGAETHVVALAVGLAKRGHRVLVASQGGPLEKELLREGIVHYRLPLTSRNPWRLWSAVREMRRIIVENEVELIHAHARIPAWVADLARNGMGVGTGLIPLITTYHAVYRAGPWWKAFTRFGDFTIAVSEDIAEYISRHLGCPGEKIAVIANGIDTTAFSSENHGKGILRRELDLGPVDGPVVVHVSRLDEVTVQRPGTIQPALSLIKATVELAGAFPALRMVIVGDGREGWQVREAAMRVNKMLGREAIICPGGRTDIPAFFALADVVVGVARVAMEGMASAKPVIIAGEGGFRGTLGPENQDELREANFTARGSGVEITSDGLALEIASLSRDPARSAQLGHFGRRMVEDEYSAERMVDKIEGVYREHRGRKWRIAILGYYGFANAGDEALLEAILQTLSGLTPSLETVVLSADPTETAKVHGVRAVYRYSPWAIQGILRKSDLLLSGGGTLLQDKTSLRSLWYYAGVIILAKGLGLKVAIFANGLGPLVSGMGRSLARRALAAADLVTWRDQGAAEMATRLGMTPKCPWEVTADPAFLLEPVAPEVSRHILERAGLTMERPVIGISLRPWKKEAEYLVAVAEAADNLVERGYDVLYIPFQYRLDEPVCRQAIELMERDGHFMAEMLSVSELLGVLGRMKLILGMRLHALILGATQDVPGIGISYDPKVEGVLRELGGPMAGRVENIRAGDILAAVENILAVESRAVNELSAASASLRERAKRNGALLEKMLKDELGGKLHKWGGRKP